MRELDPLIKVSSSSKSTFSPYSSKNDNMALRTSLANLSRETGRAILAEYADLGYKWGQGLRSFEGE